MLTVYGLKNCSTCKKATTFLSENGVEHTFIDYREHPIDSSRLSAWSKALGGWPKLVNRASMTWRNLPPEDKQPASDAEWLKLIADHAALVRRPVFVLDEDVWVGFREKTTSEKLGLG